MKQWRWGYRTRQTYWLLGQVWATDRNIATYYIELPSIAGDTDGVRNVHLYATEHGDGIGVLHAVNTGPVNRRYGLAAFDALYHLRALLKVDKG